MGDTSRLYWNTGDTFKKVLADQSSRVFISPFIQKHALETLLAQSQNTNLKIITRWNPQDICSGVSDIEIYPYLQNQHIPLYIHSEIHLKLLITETTTFHMSSNITARGLGLSAKNNVEVGCFVALEHQDWINVYKLLDESVRVTDAIYETAKQYRDINSIAPKSLPELKLEDETRGFSILDLPATPSPELLAKYYFSEDKEILEHRNASIHDLLCYQIPSGLDKTAFDMTLRQAFQKQPFIKAFLEYLKGIRSARFGQVKAWLHNTCTDQPTPYRWELTTNTQYLYTWLDYFFDEITWDRPNHSMVIRWNKC